MAQYRIYPVFLGMKDINEKSVFTYRTDFGVKIPAAYLVYLISGEGRNILVDSGAPRPEDAAKLNFPLLSDARALDAELAKLGVACSDVDAVLLTHLHWDHCYNLELFPDIPIYVQAKELSYAANPSPYDRYFYVGGPGEGLLPGWMYAFSQLVALDGEAELFPGIRVIPTPGHTKGQMSVAVDTAEGLYVIASDLCPLFENYEKGIPNGLALCFEDWFRSYGKLRALNAKVLPGHDPKVLEKEYYGG